MSIDQLIGDPFLSNPVEGIFFSVFAFLIGIISSTLGIGGGFITTPSLIILGVNEAYAIGTVLLMIIFTAISSTIAYTRHKNSIEYRTGILIAITTSIGAITGSMISSILAIKDPDLFRFIFAICLIPIAIKMIFFPKKRKGSNELEKEIEHDDIIFFGYEKREILSTILGLIAGFSSGLLGIGGGVIMVPVLVTVGKIPMHKAVATSMFIMIFTSLAGASVKISQGQIHPDLAIFLIFGIVIGAQIGPILIQKINTKRLQQIFGLMMIIALISVAIGRDQIITFLDIFFILFS